MSDVIVSTTESTTDVTTTNDVTTVAITNTVVEISQATAGLQGVPGSNSDPIYIFVRNSTGAQLNKGTIVYVSGANGTHVQVTPASASSDATSARTVGWLAEDIANNASGLCQIEGYLEGVNTQAFDEGNQLYLSTTAGGFTATKPQAPTHLVYVGVVAKKSAGNGKVFVKVQNGYELDELHNVRIISVADKNLIQYDSASSLWVNVAATAITAGSAITAGTSVYATNAGTAVYATSSGTSVYATNAGTSVYATNAGTSIYATTAGTAVTITGSITKSQVSDFTSGTVASASTAQTAGTASFADQAGTAVYASTSGTAVSISGSITKSQVSDFTSGTVASASTAQQAGTSVYAITAGTAEYATTSGTAVSISGSITRSQVSDYASGTVANISGTVTQAQVSGLGSALAGKAGLADNNTFTGTNTFTNFTTFQASGDLIPLRIFGFNGQSVDLFSVNDYLANTQFAIVSDGRAVSQKGIIATVSGTASIPLVVRGTAGQSAAITVWQNSGSTAIATVSPLGYGNFTRVTAGSTADLGYAVLSVNTGATATVGAVIRGASGQSADLQQWQNSGGTVVTNIISNGAIRTTGSIKTTALDGVAATLAIQPASTATVGAVIRGAASQSANLQEWQTSSGGTVALVDSSGQIRTSALLNLNSFNNSRFRLQDTGTIIDTGIFNNAALTVQNTNSTATANLTTWLSSAGGTVARVDSGGIVYGTQVRGLSSLVLLTEASGGGLVTMARATATPSSPGANTARLYFRDGTNAGTLKLVVRAGAAGAETTILDNIPT